MTVFMPGVLDSGTRAALCAVVGLACATGCARQEGSALRVEVRLEADAPRPSHLLVSWYGPGGTWLAGGRTPAAGDLRASGAVLATLAIELTGPDGQARSILVRGLVGERQVVLGARRLMPARGGREEVVLRPFLSDADGDGLPDDIDDCPREEAAVCRPSAADAMGDSSAARDAGAGGSGGHDVGGSLPPADGATPLDAPVDAVPDASADAGAPSPPLDLRGGLVAYWSFDEGAGSATTADRSGNGNLATLQSMDPATAWVSGPPQLGSALRFDGKGWLSTPATSAIDRLSRTYTFAAWARKETSQPRHRVILHRQIGVTAGDELWFGFMDDIPFVQPENWKLVGPAALPVGRWYHIAGTHDGTTLRLFVDGVEAASRAARPMMAPQPRGLTIGAERNDASLNANSGFFQGDLDEILIYDRALGRQDIAALAAGGRP